MANITLNEFLLGVIGAHMPNVAEVGNMSFWQDQYNLWQDGIRDGRIHDTTCKLMVFAEALESIEEDDGQPTEYEEWQDYMGGDDWDHGQYDEGAY